VEAAEKKLQAKCRHPYDQLSFHYSGVSTLMASRQSHGISVWCTCGARFNTDLDIFEDP